MRRGSGKQSLRRVRALTTSATTAARQVVAAALVLRELLKVRCHHGRQRIDGGLLRCQIVVSQRRIMRRHRQRAVSKQIREVTQTTAPVLATCLIWLRFLLG